MSSADSHFPTSRLLPAEVEVGMGCDRAWGSSPGDRAGPPLPVRPGALDGDLYGCRPNDLLMGQPIPTSTSAGSRRDVGKWLSADDMTSVKPVTNRSFLSTTCQFINLHVRPSSYNILPVMVRMKPGIYLTGTNVPSPGANTPAPARDECLEALVLTGWGKACVRPPVAT
uniref:DUF1263 domain-containing protein n=1 Tax=Oryza sativa subsp. japonica TaxID=39947 RepID=Q84R62_ORYSJ|nr:hypothetical protein [Oryza sativa Japonica Group]AAR87191.1 hypothetical protein [Oryza sativa Japonica Group]